MRSRQHSINRSPLPYIRLAMIQCMPVIPSRTLDTSSLLRTIGTRTGLDARTT